MKLARPLLSASLAIATFGTSALAAAQTIDRGVTSEPPVAPHADERRFAYVVDPRTPAAGQWVPEYTLGISSIDNDRPLPSAIGRSGVVHNLSMSFGATDWFAPFVNVTLAQPTGRSAASTPVSSDGDAPPPTSTSNASDDANAMRATAAVGGRFRFTQAGAPFQVGVVTTGYRELAGALGVSARLAASYDFGNFRVAANAHLAHVFADGRDALDYLMFAGVSYAILPQLRLGAEWIGQDLEESFKDGAEGGAKSYLGPTVAVDLDHSRVQIVFAPSYGLSPQSARVLGRVGVVVGF
jgi:hypothetical protein